jgi:hypothetical protein
VAIGVRRIFDAGVLGGFDALIFLESLWSMVNYKGSSGLQCEELSLGRGATVCFNATMVGSKFL